MLVEGLAIGLVRHRCRDRGCSVRHRAGRRRTSWCWPREPRPGRLGAGRTAASRPGIWSSASCAAPTRCRARPARPASGTCAATASTSSTASTGCTASAANAGAASRTRSSSSTPRWATLGVLLEPTTIVAKAWEQIERIGPRAFWAPKVAAITGAGPVGLLAALISVQHGYETHVFDRVTDGPKPQLVADLGATYHSESLPASGLAPDIVVECTGVSTVVLDGIGRVGQRRHRVPDRRLGRRHRRCRSTSARSIATPCCTTASSSARSTRTGATTTSGIAALAAADPTWLARLITRRVPLAEYADAFNRRPDDVKVVLEIASPAERVSRWRSWTHHDQHPADRRRLVMTSSVRTAHRRSPVRTAHLGARHLGADQPA